MDDNSQKSYYLSLLVYNDVEWLVGEVKELESKMNFHFKNTNKDIIMTQEDEEEYINKTSVDFVKKNIESDNVTQRQNIFNPFIFPKFSDYDCHKFSKNLVDTKNDKVQFDIIPKTNEECLSVTYGCIRFIDSYRFLAMSIDAFFSKT